MNGANDEYEGFIIKVMRALDEAATIVLATCVGDKVTARTVSHVMDGLTIMFQTGVSSEKAEQIRKNPRVAFAAGNLQVEAVAEVHLFPGEGCTDAPLALFSEKYKAKFPRAYALYSHLQEEVVVTARPVKVTMYEYISGEPHRSICDIPEKSFCREAVL